MQFADLAAATSFVQYYGGTKKPTSLVALEEDLSPQEADDPQDEEEKDALLGTKAHQAMIRGIPVYPNFSSHQELAKGALNGASVRCYTLSCFFLG